ncbi:MAG: hypothetical protein JWN04_5006 [Myxococcaceae bacterium]|nr:hypothetical protein [Myxococcaceae bacterium]
MNGNQPQSRARVDALVALAGWLSEMAEHPADRLEVPDLIRAHVIALDVGRDNLFFENVLAALNDAALDLLELNERRERAARHRRPEWHQAAVEKRQTVQQQIILSVAAFVIEHASLEPLGLDASQPLRQQAACEAADAIHTIQGARTDKRAACT